MCAYAIGSPPLLWSDVPDQVAGELALYPPTFMSHAALGFSVCRHPFKPRNCCSLTFSDPTMRDLYHSCVMLTYAELKPHLIGEMQISLVTRLSTQLSALMAISADPPVSRIATGGHHALIVPRHP